MKPTLCSCLNRWLALTLLAGLASLETGQAAAVDPALLERAYGQLQGYDWGQPADALLALDNAIAATHGDAVPRRMIEQRLTAILQTNASAAAKQLVCRKLALIGTGQSVPALAVLLPDQELSHMARFALERIPAAASSAALRDALSKTRGRLKVGVINSLGARADGQATTDLAPLLSDPDSAVAGAAASALGKIGTLETARALAKFRRTATGSLRPLASEAWLAAGEGLVRRGQGAEAARLFDQLYAEETGTLRLAAFRGLVRAEPDKAVELLSRALAGNDDRARSLAARMMAELPGFQALKPFLDSFALPVPGQVALLDCVHLRREMTARPVVLAACDSAEPRVRLAALRALGVIGTAEDVPRLAGLAADGSGEMSDAARLALANLPGAGPSQVIAAGLPDANPALSVELMRALAARGATGAVPAVAARLGDSSEPVAIVALEALASLGDERQVPPVIAFLKTAPAAAPRGQAEKTLGTLVARAGPKCLDALLAGLTDADTPLRITLLEQLGGLDGRQGLEAVRAAVRSDDATLREAAFRVLAGWPDWEAAPDLLQAAGSADRPAWRALAVRGYLRLCREGDIPAPERLARVNEAAKLAGTAGEKTLVVAALADVADPGALKLLTGYLDDTALLEVTSLAVVRVAAALGVQHKDEVSPLLQRVIKRCQNAEVQKQARELLNKLGGHPE